MSDVVGVGRQVSTWFNSLMHYGAVAMGAGYGAAEKDNGDSSTMAVRQQWRFVDSVVSSTVRVHQK